VLSFQAATTHDLILPRDSRHTRNLHVNIQPLQSSTEPIQALVVLSDITGFRQIEQTVTRLDRLATIGTLSASMAHEIKNALVAGGADRRQVRDWVASVGRGRAAYEGVTGTIRFDEHGDPVKRVPVGTVGE
jgi:hypothetical protein